MANTVYSASLIMTADVNQAKAQLKDLQQSLNSLMKTSHDSSPLGLTQEIAKATSDVAGLKAALQSATNTNTGKLDLSKFSKGLDAAKLDIKQVASSLQSLGPAGQQAFSQLATSIMSAEVPLKRTNQLLDNFKTTLANTVKWQISSSMVNSLVGAMQHAYGYAQDLNKSLNDIRIVTGYSTDQMSRFAKEANNAAKALSTTTTQYTDAALIYYQQGLAEKDIKARTDATIKMANVTGESAKAVSDYMTAIWNNFDNGSKSIEYYADVMTALGAATASSTDEIAAGLEKFAAVSETVGLSYEYATAALATVTAETRQSADVVGNAFKTLFSRIQGLNLGETMDDGTDLNKYSKALAKVGIDIKDTSGEIKSMNTILDELGAKWGTLSNDTQMALAQAVAGVRQYNQLISLMENWDTFKINLSVAEGAEGELQKQADIYAESWQAAADRVEASFQNIYDSILKDEFFIKLTDFFGGLIDIIGNTIDGIGGMGGAFAALGVIVSRVWGKDIGKAISSLKYDPNEAQREGTKLREETNDVLKNSYKNDKSLIGQAKMQAYSAQSNIQESLLTKQKQLEQSGRDLTEIEKAKAAIMLQQTEILGQQVIKAAELKKQTENEARQMSSSFMVDAYSMLDKDSRKNAYKQHQNLLLEQGQNAGYINNYSSILRNLQNGSYGEGDQAEAVFQNLKKDMQQLISSGKIKGSTKDSFEKIVTSESMDVDKALELLGDELDNTAKRAATLQRHLAQMLSGNPILDTDTEEERNRKQAQQQQAQQHAQTVTEQLYQQGQNLGQVDLEHQRAKNGLDINLEDNQEAINNFNGTIPGTIDKFAALAEAISMCAMGITSLIGLFDVWNNQDMSFGEKLLTTFTTLGTILPMIATSFSGANKEMLIAASNSIRASLGFSAVGASGVAAGAGATAAGTGFGVAAAGLWSLIWPIGLVIAGLTALIGIIYGVSKAIDNSNYTTKEQIENATESVEELKTALDDTKTSAEELKNTFDSYDSAVNAIKECTKGTQEYYEALNNANQAALELINNNPEIKYSTNNDGLIEINKKSQEEILKQSQQNVNKATFALQSGEQKLRDLELQKQYEDDIYFKETEAFTYGYTLVSRKDKERLLKESLETPENGSYGELLVKAMEEIDSDLWASEEDRQSYIEDANKATQAYIEAITPYTKEIEKNRQSDLNAATAQVINYLGEEVENYSQEERAVFGAFLENEKEQTIQDKEKFYRETLKQRDGANEDEDIAQLEKDWEKYKEITGLTYDLDTNAIRGSSENRKIAYYDEEAGEEKFVTAQTLVAVVGAAEAFENLGITIQETTALLQGFGKASNAMTTFIATGSFNKVKKEDKLYQFDKNEELSLDTVKNSIRGQFDILDQETKNTLMTLAGIDISAEDAWEQYLDSLSQAAIDDEEAIRDIWSNVYNTDGIVNSETFSGLSYDTQKALSEALNEAFKRGGKEAQETLNDTLSTILSNNEGLEEEIMSIFNSIDWDDIDAWEQFNQQVLAIGGNLNGISEEPFVSVMAAIANSLPIDEIDTLISKLKELYSELGKVKAGDIISDEDLQKYRENGVDIQGYETAEGFRVTEDPDLTQIDTQDYETQAGLYNYIANDEDTWVENMQNKYGGFVEQAAASNNKNANAILQTLLHRYNGDQLTQLKEQLGIGGIEDITTLNTDDSIEALRKFDSLYDKGQDGKFESGYMDQMRLTSYTNLNDLSKDEAFDFSNEATQNALQDYAYDGGEKYADALNDYQEALKEAGEDTEAINKATEDFYKRLKKIENTEAAKNIADLQDSMKDMTKGSQEYESAIGKMQTQLEKTFGKEISNEWIKNNQDVIKQWTSGATEAERALAGMEIEALGGDGAEQMIEVGLAVDTEQAQTQLQNAFSMIENLNLEPMVLECVGQGDFSALIGQLTATGASADQVAAVLSAIGSTTLSPEGFAKIAEALKALQAALQDPTNEGAVDEAIAAFNESYQMAMVGESPDVPPDMQTHTGGGGGGGGKDKADRDKLTEALSQTYQKKRDRLKAQYEGLDPESASKYIKEEIALLEEEQKILEEQIKTWKGLLKTKVQEFNQEYADELGFDLTLNDDGEIANLSEIYQRLIQMYDEGNTDLADKIYKKLQESAGIQSSIDEAVQGMMDKEREQAELELKDITDRIDWRIKQIDYQIKRLNYYQEKLLIQAHGNKQTIEAMLEGFQYQEQEMLKLFEKGDALRQGIDELNAAKAKYPNHQQMFNEQILEYQSDLIDVNKDILELRADMEELVKEVLDLALDEIDIQNERINKYVSMLDRFQNIIDLSGRSILDQALKVEIGTTKLDTLINKMSISKQTMEGLAKATAEAQAALERRAADGDETSVSMWKNQVEELERELEAAQDDFLANWEEVLQAAADIFDMRVQLIVQTLEDALSPFSNLSILEDRYTKEKQIQDQYLDDATKLYELNKLNRQLNLSIQDENDLLAKSKLRDIQQEILAYQKAGVDMSQYDLDILQKKYDLRLAEIALMEAQNSKTSMRLIRDAAGNWTYAYDSDQNAIEEAIQRVEDATYELSKATTQYIDNMSEELIAIQQDFAAAIGEVDRNASDYQEQLLYLQEHYMTRYMQTLGEFRKATEEAGISIHDTQYGMMMDLYSFEDAQNKFKLNSDTAINDLIVNYKDWQKVVEQTMNVAGTSWESFGDDTGATLDSLQEHISALCDEISKLVDVLMQYVSTAIGMVEEWQSKYSKQVDSELAKNEAYINNDSLHQSNSGGGQQSSAMDTLMRTDWNRVINEIGEKGYGTDINGTIYVNMNEVAQIRDSKVGIAAQADMNDEVVIQHESDGSLFTTEEQKAAIKTTTAQIYNDVLLKYGLIEGLGGGYNYSYNGYAPRNYGTNTGTNYSGSSSSGGSWNDPRSGWCSDWVTDVMHYSGVGDYVGGHAKVAITNHNPSRWNGGSILNGTIVGSYGGKYGHIGFFQDGYIYSTSQTGNMIDKMTIEDYINHYGTLYTTDEVSALAGYNAKKVYENQYGGSYNYTYNNLPTRLKASSTYKPFANLNRYGPTPMLYDTGGYTGEWGNEGRWAMLHEKELVLNKKDTPNILSAVKIARSIDDTISNLTSNTDWKLRNLLGFTDPIFDNQPIEQTIQINAEFPGVTDQYEIQEALSNLSNDASQYLNIKRNLF